MPLTTRDMQRAFPVIERPASTVRRLILISVLSGAIAGVVWFGAQYFVVIPLIQAAETFKAAAHDHTAVHHGQEEGWHPSDGWQRNSLTAGATVLTGIAFAAILFGSVSLAGSAIDVRRGALWGLAGFICFSAAPALGLPPEPPGVAVADLTARQLWWAATVVLTAAGLWLIFGQHSRSWVVRACGLVFLMLPHLVGAPVAAGESVAPAWLVRQFTTACVLTAALFWLTLGIIGGFFSKMYLPRTDASKGA
jgi:cobalt transporter subunit CbtA